MSEKDEGKNVLFVDVGTFCDHRLMDTVLETICSRQECLKVFYITDQAHEKGLESACNKVKPYFINNPEGMIKYADELASASLVILSSFAFRNPGIVKGINSWMNRVGNQITELINDVDVIVAEYSAIAALQYAKIGNTPVYILYFAPGLINYDIPMGIRPNSSTA